MSDVPLDKNDVLAALGKAAGPEVMARVVETNGAKVEPYCAGCAERLVDSPVRAK